MPNKLLEISGEITPERMKGWSQSKNNTQLWMELVMDARFDTVRSSMSRLSPCLFNLYAEYIMRNARLNEAQAGIKIARRNINNLRYADDTILMAEVKKN